MFQPLKIKQNEWLLVQRGETKQTLVFVVQSVHPKALFKRKQPRRVLPTPQWKKPHVETIKKKTPKLMCHADTSNYDILTIGTTRD